MEIRGQQPESRRPERREVPQRRDLSSTQETRRNEGADAQRSRRTADGPEADRVRPEVDRLDLSEGARAARRLTENGTAPDRLRSLRELYQSGRLNNPERIEAAAAKILGKQIDGDV